MSKSLSIATANINLPPMAAMTWSAAQHEAFLYATGYNGIELHPSRSLFLAEIWLGLGSVMKAVEIVTSQHQSFRGERWRDVPGKIRDSDDSLLESARRYMGVVAGLPRMERSLAHIAMVQKRAGRPLPTVLYPTKQDSVDGPGRRIDYPDYIDRRHGDRLGPRLWQPTAEVLNDWDIPSSDAEVVIDGMTKVMYQKGYSGVCIDTYHWLIGHEGRFMPPWEEALPLLAAKGMVDEVHFGPARTDLGGDASQLQQVLAGNIERTESGRMLLAIRDGQPPDQRLYVVTEVPPAAIGQLGYKDKVGPHRDMVTAIRDLVAA